MSSDDSDVREALNHLSLQVDRDDPRPRPMIAVLDAKPGMAGQLREKIAGLARQVRREPGASPSPPTKPATHKAASTSTRSTPAPPRSTSTSRPGTCTT